MIYLVRGGNLNHHFCINEEVKDLVVEYVSSKGHSEIIVKELSQYDSLYLDMGGAMMILPQFMEKVSIGVLETNVWNLAYVLPILRNGLVDTKAGVVRIRYAYGVACCTQEQFDEAVRIYNENKDFYDEKSKAVDKYLEEEKRRASSKN